jgi:hypothetical protein
VHTGGQPDRACLPFCNEHHDFFLDDFDNFYPYPYWGWDDGRGFDLSGPVNPYDCLDSAAHDAFLTSGG